MNSNKSQDNYDGNINESFQKDEIELTDIVNSLLRNKVLVILVQVFVIICDF